MRSLTASARSVTRSSTRATSAHCSSRAEHVLEHLGGAYVGRIEAHRLFEPFGDRLRIAGIRGEPQLHLCRAHEHRALVDVVGSLLGLTEVGRDQILPPASLAGALLERLTDAGVAGDELEITLRGGRRALLVEQLVVQHTRALAHVRSFHVAPFRHGHGEIEQAHHGIPFPALAVPRARGVEQSQEIGSVDVAVGSLDGARECFPGCAGVGVVLKLAEGGTDGLCVHSLARWEIADPPQFFARARGPGPCPGGESEPRLPDEG